LTKRYTSQKNGVEERKNRKIIEMMWNVIKVKGLPNSFWVGFADILVYMMYICLIKSVNAMTPKEARSGRNPSVPHLNVFECIEYYHVLKEK
jgi:hypothetical protein